MKPQILETAGYNNTNLATSTERVIKAGTWKKQRIVMIVPSADMIASRVYLSHLSMAFPPNQSVHRMLALGCEVGDAYSRSIAEIVDNPQHPCFDWEYVLTVESDNCPPFDGVVKLIKRMEENPHLSAICGLYWCKGADNIAPHIWGEISDPVVNYRPQPPKAGELVECYGLSMGFTLYRMSMFKDKRIARPFFKTYSGIEGKGIGTQDLSFWAEARKYGYRCAVDCGVLVGHWDQTGAFGPAEFMW
tara:strand:- start:6513 stop:7253 length:741 start_codon:yes stop_codon:yes gene_type:complete